MGHLLLTALCLAAASAVAPRPGTGDRGPAASTIPAVILDEAFVLVPLQLDGAGPFLFLLDTGGHATLLSDVVARRLGLAPAASATMQTVAGSRSITVGRIGTLELAGRSWSNVPVSWTRLDALHELDPRIDGVLGLDALGDTGVLIDYEAGVVSLLSAAVAERELTGTKVPTTGVNGRPVVTGLARGGAGGRHLRLVLDSGAQAAVLFGPAGALAPVLDRADRPGAQLSTHAGTSTVPLFRLRRLTVGDRTLENQLVAIVDRPPGDDQEDGLFPAAAFSRVYFAFPDGYVILDPERRAPADAR